MSILLGKPIKFRKQEIDAIVEEEVLASKDNTEDVNFRWVDDGRTL